MSITGPDARLVAAELLSEARQRLLDGLLRPRTTTTAVNTTTQRQTAVSAKHIPSGFDPGRVRLTARMIDAHLLDPATADASKFPSAESPATRAVSNYLGNDGPRMPRPDSVILTDIATAASATVNARPDVVVALGSPLFKNRQLQNVDTPTDAMPPNAGRLYMSRLGESSIAQRRVGKTALLAALSAAALVLLLMQIF